MGKLAERLADAQRSGVYRVEVTEALEEATMLNGFPLVRIALDEASADELCACCAQVLTPGLDGSWRGLASALADPGWKPAPGHVLLFSGFEALQHRSSRALDPLLEALQSVAAARRARGQSFFAAFLDRAAMLALGPLYNWHRQIPAELS